MHFSSKAALALAGLAALGLAAVPASAQVTVGTTNDGNYIPFGNGVDILSYPEEYQQLYNPADFAGPLTISSVGFASNAQFGAPGPATFNATISLGTAATAFDSPSTTFATNEGADFQQVFSGIVSTTLKTDGSFDLVFPTSAFTYTPGNGALLLDIVLNTTPTLPKTPEFFNSDDSGADFHRVYVFKGVNLTDGEGLVTQFNGAPPVPEASTTVSFGLLLALGLGAVGIAKRKKQSA